MGSIDFFSQVLMKLDALHVDFLRLCSKTSDKVEASIRRYTIEEAHVQSETEYRGENRGKRHQSESPYVLSFLRPPESEACLGNNMLKRE